MRRAMNRGRRRRKKPPGRENAGATKNTISMPQAAKKIRLAAVGDLHYGKTSQGLLQPLFSQINGAADILLLLGDLTDYGLPDEATALAKELGTTVRIPIIGVLGNHDYESGQE